MTDTRIDGLGDVSIRAVAGDHPRPTSASRWDDWGDMDPTTKDLDIQRWIIEVTDHAGARLTVGDLSAHAVWYGPTFVATDWFPCCCM